jgi:uncharacterized damage-inducible protein DinB
LLKKEFLEYLPSVHGRTRRLIERIRPEDCDWRPAPDRFSMADIVRHLATIERYMYGETVCGRPSAYPGHGPELADGLTEVIAFYDRMHEESVAIFESLSEDAFAGKVITPAGSPITLWKWLRAMLEHEAHHRGQLYLLLGLRGVPTPPIYGLTSEEVREKSVLK